MNVFYSTTSFKEKVNKKSLNRFRQTKQNKDTCWPVQIANNNRDFLFSGSIKNFKQKDIIILLFLFSYFCLFNNGVLSLPPLHKCHKKILKMHNNNNIWKIISKFWISRVLKSIQITFVSFRAQHSTF